jgi:hypothetical protein
MSLTKLSLAGNIKKSLIFFYNVETQIAKTYLHPLILRFFLKGWGKLTKREQDNKRLINLEDKEERTSYKYKD